MLATVYGLSSSLDFPFPCELHARAIHKYEESSSYKVLFTHTEPMEFCMSIDMMKHFQHHFDLIITCHPEHLVFPQAVFDVYGGLWAKTIPRSKNFSVSFIYSQGLASVRLPGYGERTGVLTKSDRVRIPTRFYRSRRVAPDVAEDWPLLEGDRKDHLFESMFHICFENCRSVNYFSEKLCDCLATYTIPIYWGCPNIGEYFNMDGIIVAESHEHAIDLLNNLTPVDYWERLEAMRDNYRRSRKYWDWSGRMRTIILREYAKSKGQPAGGGFQI